MSAIFQKGKALPTLCGTITSSIDWGAQMDTTTKPENKDVVALLRSFHSFEAEQREHAISALQSLDKESTVEILVKLLKDSDPDLRCDAAEALVRIDSKQGTETILPLLSDPDPAVRWNACPAL